MTRRLTITILCCLIGTLGAAAQASAAVHFAYATPSFQSQNFVVTWKEAGLGRRHKVTYLLTGWRNDVYQCADGSNGVSLSGPIGENTGTPGDEPPLTVTLTSNRRGVIRDQLSAAPFPPVEYTGSAWIPVTCTDGAAPDLVIDQFYDDPGGRLRLTDETHGRYRQFTGTYGYCQQMLGCH